MDRTWKKKRHYFLSLFLPRFPAAVRSPGPGLPDGRLMVDGGCLDAEALKTSGRAIPVL